MTEVTEAELRERAGDDPGAHEIVDLWVQTKAEVEEAMRGVTWGEDEITQAQARHPTRADLLWHAWRIILPASVFPYTEFVWRGHMRELLERVAAGEDTRTGTYAEVCMVCRGAAEVAPLTHAATGAYFRAWHHAFPGNPVWDTMAEEVAHGVQWNDHEISEILRDVRGKIGRRMGSRRIDPRTVCDGRHGSAEVGCRFIPGTLDGSWAPRPAPPRPRKPGRRRPPPAAAVPLRADLLDSPALPDPGALPAGPRHDDEEGELTLF